MTAWAQAASAPTRPAALVSAEATNASGFAMGFVPNPTKTGDGLWQAVTARADTAETEYDWAGNAQPMNSVTDWNHIALVYDGFARQLRIYVNGELGEAACLDVDGDGQADDAKCIEVVPWAEDVLSIEALKSLQIGRAKGRDAFRAVGFFCGPWPRWTGSRPHRTRGVRWITLTDCHASPAWGVSMGVRGEEPGVVTGYRRVLVVGAGMPGTVWRLCTGHRTRERVGVGHG
nr:LamG domain-containing protein [Streptomyces inhibens]